MQRFQHHIITTKSTFPVRSQHIPSFQFRHQPQYKAVIETFRQGNGRSLSRIKIAKRHHCHTVHIDIHCLYIVLQQCTEKFIIITIGIIKPSANHMGKHNVHLFISQCQCIIPTSGFLDKFHLNHFKISACKQKAPYSIRLLIQLPIHHLLVNLTPEGIAPQQVFKFLLNLLISLPDQLPCQAV